MLRNFVTGNEHHEQGQNNYDNCEMTDYADDENYENNENYESFENQEHWYNFVFLKYFLSVNKIAFIKIKYDNF